MVEKAWDDWGLPKSPTVLLGTVGTAPLPPQEKKRPPKEQFFDPTKLPAHCAEFSSPGQGSSGLQKSLLFWDGISHHQ
jgi:hypothetical protein